MGTLSLLVVVVVVVVVALMGLLQLSEEVVVASDAVVVAEASMDFMNATAFLYTTTSLSLQTLHLLDLIHLRNARPDALSHHQ